MATRTTFWMSRALLLVFIAVVFGSASVSTASIGINVSLNIAYNATGQSTSVYDGIRKSVSGYDESSIPNADHKEKTAVGERSHFADFAKSVAAESGGIRLSQKGLNLLSIAQ